MHVNSFKNINTIFKNTCIAKQPINSTVDTKQYVIEFRLLTPVYKHLKIF